jgi:hypothetical protein
MNTATTGTRRRSIMIVSAGSDVLYAIVTHKFATKSKKPSNMRYPKRFADGKKDTGNSLEFEVLLNHLTVWTISAGKNPANEKRVND